MRHFLSLLVGVYRSDIRALKALTLVLYPLSAIGIYFSWRDHATDTALMFSVVNAPDYCHALFWGVAVMFLTVSRFVGLFVWQGTYWTRRLTPVIGVVFWSLLLGSNLADRGTLVFGFMFVVPALMETWIVSRAWQEK